MSPQKTLTPVGSGGSGKKSPVKVIKSKSALGYKSPRMLQAKAQRNKNQEA